jgi:hypothetical protein
MTAQDMMQQQQLKMQEMQQMRANLPPSQTQIGMQQAIVAGMTPEQIQQGRADMLSQQGMGPGLAGMGQPQPSMGTGLAGMTPQQIQQLQSQTQQQTPPGMPAGMMNDMARERAQFQANQLAVFQQNARNQGQPQQGLTAQSLQALYAGQPTQGMGQPSQGMGTGLAGMGQPLQGMGQPSQGMGMQAGFPSQPQQPMTAQAMKAGFLNQPQQAAPQQNPAQQGIGSLPAQTSAPAAAKPAGMF